VPGPVSALIGRYVDEALNGASTEVLRELFLPNYRDHEPLSGAQLGSLADLELLVGFLGLASTDIAFVLEDVFEAGDRGAYRIFGEGTGSADEFLALARVGGAAGAHDTVRSPLSRLPTGIMHYHYSSTGIFVVRGGRFAERWGHEFVAAEPWRPGPAGGPRGR